MSLCDYLPDCDDNRAEGSRLMGNDVETQEALQYML